MRTALVLLVTLAAVWGFSLAAIPGEQGSVTPASEGAPTTAVPTASGAITPLANSSSGYSPTSPTVMGNYLIVPNSEVPVGDSPLPSDVTAMVALTPSANLENLVNELSDPNNPGYRHFLTINQVGSEFGSTSYATAVQYFESYGLTVQLGAGLLTLSVSGTPDQMGAAFHTTLTGFAEEYHSNGTWNPLYGDESAVAGSTTYAPGFYANTAPLSLPASLTGVVAGIAGLSGLTAQPAIAMPTGIGPADSGADLSATTIQGLADANYTWTEYAPSNENCVSLGECGDVQTLYPSTMSALSGAKGLWNGTNTINGQSDLGQGITIALVEVGCLDLGTVQGFSNEVWDSASQPGLNLTDRLTQIGLNTSGAEFSNTNYAGCVDNGYFYGWTIETALDAEYAATEAPMAGIDIVATASNDFSAFDVAYQDIADYLTGGATTLPSSVGTVVEEDGNVVSSQSINTAVGSVTITSNSYGSGEVYAAMVGSPMYLTVENTLLEEMNVVGVTNFFSSGDTAPVYGGSANQAGMPAVSPGSTSVGGGQTTAESNGQEFPVTSNVECPSGFVYAGAYDDNPYCSPPGQTLGVVGTVSTQISPNIAPVYDSANGYVYVPNQMSNTVTVIDGTAIMATVSVGSAPISAAVGGNGYVYVMNYGKAGAPGDTVSVINGTSVVATLVVGDFPSTAAYDSSNGYVYEASEGYQQIGVPGGIPGSVSVISGTSVVANISLVDLGTDPQEVINCHGISIGAANDIYVTESTFDEVAVIHGTSFVGNVSVGSLPVSEACDSVNGYVYVLNKESNNVSILSGTSLKATVGTGDFPFEAAFDTTNGYVYVTNTESNNVSVISGTSVVATVDVGNYPEAVAYDSADRYVFVANFYSDSVSAINGTSVVATFNVGTDPDGADYDSANGYVYVTNQGSNSVSVIGVVSSALSAEECYDYGLSDGTCAYPTMVVAPATGLASFSYWSSGVSGSYATGTDQGITGGSFGQSFSELQPWYQNALDTYSSGATMDPFVSFEAAFNMTIYEAEDGGWLANYGGTSFAAPTIAGEWALIEEQASVAYGTPKMGDINPLLYGAHNANEARVSSFSTDPYVDMTDIGTTWDTSPYNDYNWYYTNLSIDQPYDPVLPGWFNTIDNPAGPGWNYLQGLGAINVSVMDEELIGGPLLSPAFEVEIVTSSGLEAITNDTLAAGTTYTFEVVASGQAVAGATVEAYSGMSNDGMYGGGTTTLITTGSDGQFVYTPTMGTPPGEADATTYGFFLVTSGSELSFAQLAIAQPSATGTLSLCVVEPDGVCQSGTAEVTTFQTGYTGYYNLFPEAYVTLNGVPAADAVITEVSENVAPYYYEDPTMPLSSYAPGATLGTFLTGTMGDANFWADAYTAELDGAVPTQVVTLTASYDGLVSNTVTVFIEPQVGSYDTSDLSLNSAGTAVVGTLTFSSMKYVDFLNVSVGSAPGQYVNYTCPLPAGAAQPANTLLLPGCDPFYDSQVDTWVSSVDSGQMTLNLSTAGLTGPINVSLVASGTNDLSNIEFHGGVIVLDRMDVQNPITWAYFMTATIPPPSVLELEFELAEAEATISDLQSEVAYLQNGWAGANATIASLNRQVTTLTSELSAANASLAALQAELSGDSTTIASLESGWAAANATIASLGSEVSSLQAGWASANETIASLTGQVSTLAGQLSSEEGNVTSLEARLSAAESENTVNATLVASLQAQLLVANTTIASLQTQLTTDEATIATDQGTISSDQTQLTADKSQLAADNATLAGDQSELNAKKNYVAPTWYTSIGSGGLIAIMVAIAVIVGLVASLSVWAVMRRGKTTGSQSRSPPGPEPPETK